MSNLAVDYRPNTWAEMVGNQKIVASIKADILGGSLPHAIFLSGATGNGKTTLAYLIARSVNCEGFLSGETDDICGVCPACQSELTDYYASERSGVDDFRSLLKSLTFVPEFRRRVIIVNEVQELSDKAENLLLGALESRDVAESSLIILTSNMPEKMKPTVKNRTTQYLLSPMTKAEQIDLIGWVVESEYDMAPDDATVWATDNVAALLDTSDGSVRGILNQIPVLFSGAGGQHAESLLTLDKLAVDLLRALILHSDVGAVIRHVTSAYNVCTVSSMHLSSFAPQVRAALHYLLVGLTGNANWYPPAVKAAAKEFSGDDMVYKLCAASKALLAAEEAMSKSRYEMTAQINNFYTALLVEYSKNVD